MRDLLKSKDSSKCEFKKMQRMHLSNFIVTNKMCISATGLLVVITFLCLIRAILSSKEMSGCSAGLGWDGIRFIVFNLFENVWVFDSMRRNGPKLV